MPSIHRRLLLGTALIVAIVVLLTGTAVNYSVFKRAEASLQDRLQGLIYGLLGATNVNSDNSVVVNEAELPDPQLSTPGDALFAQLVGNLGEPYWRSMSRVHTQPKALHSPIGEWQFTRHRGESTGHVYALQLTIVWELSSGEELPIIVQAVSDAAVLDVQLATFRRTLWTSLAIAAAVLLLAQLLILRRALAPLNTIRQELNEIESGQRDTLDESVAKELMPLANGINTLVVSERNRQAEFRHLVDDLAHTLKTPLSVLANVANQTAVHPDDHRIVGEQCEQMHASLQQYLGRAAGRTTQALVSPIMVKPPLIRLAESLPKIHRQVTIHLEPSINDDLKVRVAEADLFEILGNLLDNACKYGASQVWVSADVQKRQLFIDDDGRGFDTQVIAQLTSRGVRADTQVSGQGLGLASSRTRLIAYGGTLDLDTNTHGGARVILDFP